MIKKIFIIFSVLFAIVATLIIYLSKIGIETNKFNSLIKNEIKSHNNKLDVNLNKVKLILDIKEFNININTLDPTIIYNNQKILLKKISFSFSINSYLNKTFGVKKVEVFSKNNKIKNLLDFYRQIEDSSQLYIISQIIKDGEISFNTRIEFNEKGKILPNYIIFGDIKKANISFLKYYNFQDLGFKYKISKDNYNLKNVLFKFNKISFNSKKILIEKKNKYHLVEGNLKSNEGNLNQEILSIFFKDNLNNINIDKAKILSDTDFSFKINNNIKIKNISLKSKLNISDLKYSFTSNKVKKYFPEYKDEIYFRDNILDIKYSKNNLEVVGSNNYSLNDLPNNLNFKINKINKLYNFDFDINLDNYKILLNQISYSKDKNKKANLIISGKYKKNNYLILNNINFLEGKNSLNIKNLKINKDYKIIKFDKISNNYLTENKIKNNYSITFNNKKYIISGDMYDGIKLIDAMFEDNEVNYFDVFSNLNNHVLININKVYIDEKNYVNNLEANINFNNNKINKLNLESNFSNYKKITLTINTTDNNEIITTIYSTYPKPLVKRYKFIKGFEDGVLDFQSIKKGNVSKSTLKIDNFKVKEVPALAKLLSLASLQGIADTLTGEGIRFTDFEMIFSNEDDLITIDEIYAIGPAISILMKGYVEKNKLISLRGTLVPARTINRTIASIPLLGDILIGKKVGEGVFGVSFKIKGPLKKLKTTVNPVKTLTPRFITRTLEKIKKN